MGKLATSPLPYWGAPPLQSGGQNQKWPTCGQIGYLTPAVSGSPTASERGAKSEVAHLWANWLPHPCRIGEPNRFRAGGKIRSGPQVGKLATSPLPYRGAPPLQSGGQNQKWPTCGQIGYLTPAVLGSPTASQRGAKSEVAHLWANWLPHPCRIGEPHRFRAGGKIRSGPKVGKLATSPLPYWGAPPLHSGGQNQKWPTCGQIGYLTPAVSGSPTASQRGAKSEVAHKWANWVPHPCRIGEPHRFRAGGKIRSGPLVGKLATSPLPYRGAPPLQSGGAKSEVAQKGANWLPHPCRIGEPHRFRAGGKIRSGPLVGKLATSPLPYRGAPPLQSGGQNQKWPTCGQIGYLTPAVSGSTTASERGAKSEVAHLWANWLPHPCRIGEPHRFTAGGKIRSGPEGGKLATSPLPYWGAPPLQSGGQNQKWPTCGQIGYLTPAVSGSPTASERGAKSEVAHLWANWLPHPCRIGEPHRFRAGGKIRSGPQVGKLATSPLPYREAPPLQSGGQNQKWPTCGQIGYLTPAVLGSPTASERGAKSEVAQKGANWLPHPRRIGEPHRFRAGGQIRSGPQVGKLATSPLPCQGAPPLQSGGQNQKWPRSGQTGYLTPAVLGSPTASQRGAKSEVAHLWANWLPHPCRIGEPHRFTAGGKIRSGPQVGKLATSPLPYRGAPPLQSGGQNQKWPRSGQIGYLTPAVSGSPTASERGAKSEVAQKGANWLPHPCRIGEPHRFRAGGKIRSGPEVGKLATSPLPYWGAPPLQTGGQNQKWPTCGQIGYFTPAVSGSPTASERGAKSEVAHKWANWLPHPCRIGEPHRFRAGGKIRSGPEGGKLATSPLPYWGAPPLQSGGQNQKWPRSGQIGYLTPAVLGSPTASERGAKSEVAHLWANWLPHPCRIGEPHRFRAGGKIRSGPLVGKLADSPLPYWGAPPLHSGGQNQKWPTCGQIGYLTPAVLGSPTASERGAKSEVAHLWANWLPHPCRIRKPHRFRAGGKIRIGPLVGKLATSPLPYWGAPPLQSGGQNQKWPTSGKIGYLTPAVSGSPTASERGAKSEVAHLWANWLPHPCRIGEPHRFRAGGKIRSGPEGGKLATSPPPYRGAPSLQSRGPNQKWPTSGHIGYLTPAVSGSPTASERRAKSEVAQKWASWLPHPCRIGEPHRFRAGGKIRSGPEAGKLATSPLPYWGAPPLHSGGQNQKWPTCGQIGYLTPAVSGSPTASERGAKSEVAHLWANWLPHPCRIGEPHRSRAGGQNQKWPTCGQIGYLTPAVSGSPTASERGAKSEVAHLWANWLPHPCRIGEPHRFRAGGKIRSGPLVGKLATSPLPYWGAPPLQSGGQNQKWPTSGQIGYLTPAVLGSPTASDLGAKSEVAHLWANWLPHPCRIGEPHRFRAGGKIRSGPQVGKLATSPLPYRGAPPLQSGGQNQKWPTCGQIGYLTPAVSGSPTAPERGGKIRSGPLVGKLATSPLPYRGAPPLQSGGQNQKWPKSGQIGYLTPAVSGSPTASERGAKSEVAHLWANWLPHPCRIGEPHRFRAGGKIRSGPQVGKLATSPLPYWGAPPLQTGGQNQKWPTCGQIGYLTPAVSGSPTASERGAKSEVAHLWANWLPHPCRIGEPHRFRAGGKIRSGPQVGKLATSPLPYRGAPPLQSGGQNQKWPTCGQIGYLTTAVLGSPTASERRAKSEVAQKWANWLPHPCRIGEPHRFKAGGKIRSGPLVDKLATSPLPYRGAPPLQSGGQNQKWPTCGQIGYLTPAVSGSPTASERGAKSEVAQKGANWLPHPCRIGEPHRFTAGGKIRSGPLVGNLATSPLPYWGAPPLQSGGQNQKWPRRGQIGYLTPAVLGSPTASQRGAKSEVAHLWANWLPHPCRIGEPHRFRAGGKIRSGPLVGKLATSPLPYRGAPPLQSGGAKSEVAHLWANWLPHPCRIGEPHRFRAGGKIRSGPLVGKLATSPLPYRGAPPLQSGGQNQKWPTCGQIGYLTPAVLGSPTASERGAKSEVAHKWANWLPHPCLIGEPHRFRPGGKIRSGPLVGKLATSPLPYRGAPPLQSGGQNQKWPTCEQIGYLTPAVSGSPTASERGAKSEVAQKGANWLPHHCRIGEPHSFRAEGKIRSGPEVGKLATSPLPYWGAPPLHSGGQNQKWPTCGQIGYLTPAVSGSPTASERGAKSEVAHLSANWLPHPCRIGEPHRFRAGGRIRSGPLVGKLATSPLPYRGAPPLQSGGQNQKWPTCGQIGYLIPAVSGSPTASERGAKSEVAHLWANWLPHPCRIGEPHRFRAGGKIRSGPLVGKLATSPLPYFWSPTASERGGKSEVAQKWANWLPHPCGIGEPHRFRPGGKIRSGPLVGKLATSPLPYRGAPPLQSGGQNQNWPRRGQIGYLTTAVLGSPTASERGAKSEVAHKWANWLLHPCRIGEPHRFRAGGKIRSGPQVGKLATSPLPYRGAPPLQSGGQNQNWPRRGQIGYLTTAVLGSPTASERGAKSEVAHLWANWLPHPCRIGEPYRFRAGGKIRSGPQVGKLVTSPLPYRGAPPLQSGGQNQKWPTSGQIGYLTPAVLGSPTASQRWGISEVAHLWANWLPHPCRIGEPHRFRAGGKIRSGPLVGKLATSPLPYRGAPPLQSGGQNQKWPTCGQIGYLTPAVLGSPTASERGAKSEVAHKWANWLPHPCRIGSPTASERGAKSEVAHLWANWLPHPCRIGEPHRFRAGGKIRSGPQVGKLATSPLPYWGAPPLHSGGEYQKWPTCGQIGYLTPAVLGSPTASERGAKSEVAHKWANWLPHPCRIGSPTASERVAKSEVAHLWANWLPHPCRIGEPHRFRAGGKIRSGPQVGKLATSPLPYWGAPPLHSGGEYQKWPTCGQIGYLTPAVSGSPTASERGAKSEVAHLWANWLPHPCRIGEPHRFRAGGKIRRGPLVGKLATSPLPYWGALPLQSGGQNQKWPTSGQIGYLTPAVSGAPPLQSGGQNQKWPTCGQIGYLTPAVSGSPTASERGAKSEVAHKWANWLPHPCRIGEPHRFTAVGNIRSGPLVGKLATSPLPYRGAPPLQSGGQNQKWPTCGQIGYLTPAVTGSPYRFRAGGKIRSGPQVGKLATSPLPYWGAPRLQSGGEYQKWPTCGQIGYLTPAVLGSPTASERGAKSEVAHLWANWLPHPCRIGEPHRFRAGGKIRSGPLVGKLATSPLPYRGAPPVQSGGQNQKWPTRGQATQ